MRTRRSYVKSSSTGRKIPYNLVSSFVILRDYADIDGAYINSEHKDLVDIADGMYNVGESTMLSQMKPKYRDLYDAYGSAYFNKVLDDIAALDSQINRNNVDDLVAEVNDLLAPYGDDVEASTRTKSRRPVRASRRITASTAASSDIDYLRSNGDFVDGAKTRMDILDKLNKIDHIIYRLYTAFGSVDSEAFCDLYECRDSDGNCSNGLMDYNGIIGYLTRDIDKIYDILDKQFPNGESDVETYEEDVNDAFMTWLNGVEDDVRDTLDNI